MMGMKRERQGWARRIRRLLPRWGFRRRYTGMMALSSDGRGVPIRQTKLAPDGVELCEDVSDAKWVEESLTDFGTLRSMLPGGFPAYARIFHPAYMNGDEDQPVRWATVASWTGRAAHPLMQFERIAGLPEDSMYPDPPWGEHPTVGSLPKAECRTLIDILRKFTTTPGDCRFCLWEGYGNIDARLYRAAARVKAPGRDYLLFQGPIDAALTFTVGEFPFWGDSPNIWWPEDRAWCVATDIDLFDTYVAGSRECIDAVLNAPGLEALPASRDAQVSLDADTINAPDNPRAGC